MKIQWMWNGIKVDGKLYRAHYSKCVLIGDTEESITVYAKDYDLPNIGLKIENHTDIITDYFDEDKYRIDKNCKFWPEVYQAFQKQQIKSNKRMEKRAEKYGFEFRLVAIA